MDQGPGILNSWKEIASYLGRGVRTVQRWHDMLQLPVHRINFENPRSPVFAYREELDHWMARRRRRSLSSIRQKTKSGRTVRQLQSDFQQQLRHTRTNRVNFMSIDLDTALTLVTIAEQTSNPSKRSRNEANARRALDTILNLYRSTQLTQRERRLLDGKIADLEAALERLGP